MALYSYITCKMGHSAGHPAPFLKIDHLAWGLIRLLNFFSDPNRVEWFMAWPRRFQTEGHPPNTGLICPLGDFELQGGVTFHWDASCSNEDRLPRMGLSWLESAKEWPAIFSVDVYPTHSIDSEEMRAGKPAEVENLPLEKLDLGFMSAADFMKIRFPNIEELKDIFPAMTRARLRRLAGRSFQQVLGPLARPRLFLAALPEDDAARNEMALGLLALLGLYAGKNGIMDVTKDGGAFQMFQEYAQLVGGWWLTKCEEREQGLRLSVLGKLFVRLYHPRARGRGFQAPANAKAFKLYVFKANRGAALSVLNRLPELPGESVMEEEREDDHNRKKKVRPRPRRTGADPSTSVEERPDASR